ncbi:MAG: hypothetical protein ACRECC_00935 [Pseudolabrys sp.]
MKRRFAAVAFALVCVLATPAYARHHKTHAHHVTRSQHVVKTHRVARTAGQIDCNNFGCTPSRPYTRTMSARTIATGIPAEALTANASVPIGGDPRPHSWCGWWLRHYLGVADRSFNLARNWTRYGSPAGGPSVGTIVVWRSHVGIITGSSGSGWIIKSGNDDHAVRERERSLRGVIAYRTR